MKNILKRLFIIIAFIVTATCLNAQSDNRAIVEECKQLYSEGDYTTVLTTLKKIDTKNLNTAIRQEVNLLQALATFETDALAGRSLILQYIDDYPTAKTGMLNSYIAESYYYTGNFSIACSWFGKSDIEQLPYGHRDRAKIHYALSLIECNDSNGTRMLNEIANTSKTHAEDATFHLATANYNTGNLKEAYKGFKKVEFTDKFYLEVPYYIAGIYLKQGKAIEAKDIATLFIADHKDKPQGIKMLHILGGAEYTLGDYKTAISSLTQYINSTKSPQRIAFYQLGMSLFETGSDNATAIEMLSKCCNADNKKARYDDAITQNSLLHLGIIKLQNNNLLAAENDFAEAASMKHDISIREKAMYNHALCMYLRSNGTSEEVMKGFEQFINEFPASEYTSKAAMYLVEIYMNSEEYSLALRSIERIDKPTATIFGAKQKILYYIGAQEFTKGDMRGCIEYLDRSIELKKYDKETHSAAEYLKGEALYNMEEYNKAELCYRNALTAGSKNATMAIYGLAYALFQQKSYSKALAQFEIFVKKTKDDRELLSDAHNRIADCHFYQRRYTEADKHYKLASAMSKNEADYALFRSALTMGLAKDYEGKVRILKQMLEEFPNSSYTGQAYYEMGRAYVELEKYEEAMAIYDKLIKKFPQGEFARRAAAEKAMIYNTSGDKEKAIKAYKEIIEKYPGSEEAEVAMQDLKSIYIESGHIDEFAEYAGKTNGMGEIDKDEVDSLTYIIAEKTYTHGNKNEAKKRFIEYLEKHPEGKYRIDSHYYLGTIFLEEKETNTALKHFAYVIEAEENRYTLEALQIVADIHYENGDMDKAKATYKSLVSISHDEGTRLNARIRIMIAAYKLKEYRETIEVASDIISDSQTKEGTTRQARYYRAKAYLGKGDNTNAIKDLSAIATETSTLEGAEAKYLYAQILFDQGKYSDCEKELDEYIEMSTPHTYWLARSFILLSDVYTKQGKTTTARQYLISLQRNYKDNDDIKDMIESRLAALDKQEKNK